jgi:putative hydrolase of the HAD superfamily
MTIQALLIDLDGVIRYWNPATFTAAETTYGLPAGALPRTAFAPELLLPAITGVVTDTVWRQQVAAQLQKAYPAADVVGAVAAWSQPAGEVVQPVLALIRQCRRSIPVVLVTNATSRLPIDLATLGIREEFDHVINSSVVGVAKPDVGIFTCALQAVGVPAADALFVDDTKNNVVAAIDLGLYGYHFQSPTGLQKVLQEHGLLG